MQVVLIQMVGHSSLTDHDVVVNQLEYDSKYRTWLHPDDGECKKPTCACTCWCVSKRNQWQHEDARRRWM